MEIQLTYRRADFEAIYFKDRQGSWLLNETVRLAFIYLLLAIVGFAISIVFAFMVQLQFWIALLILAVIVVNFLIKFNEYAKWRRSINNYLKAQEKFKKSSIELTKTHFSLIQDQETMILALSGIKTCRLTPDWISLEGTERVFIPAKSMTPAEFNILKSELKTAIVHSTVENVTTL